jgi:hypothetical protein
MSGQACLCGHVQDVHISGIAEKAVTLTGSQFPDNAQAFRMGQAVIDNFFLPLFFWKECPVLKNRRI